MGFDPVQQTGSAVGECRRVRLKSAGSKSPVDEIAVHLGPASSEVVAMEPIVESCAGLDVHQKSVVACVLWGPLNSKPKAELRKFGTTTGELLELAGGARR